MERILKTRSGYSFAEVVIAMVILSIVALLMGTILTTSTKMHRSSFSSDDAYAIAREKLASLQREGVTVFDGSDSPNRNNIQYHRSWVITKGTDETDPVKAVITVSWTIGSTPKNISITGYIESEFCPEILSNHKPDSLQLSLSHSPLDKNLPIGSIIGEITVFDQDVGDLHTAYLASGGADNDKFTIVGKKIYLNHDFSSITSDVTNNVLINARDCNNETLTTAKAVTITVSAAAGPPGINDTTFENAIFENSAPNTFVGTVQATDADKIKFTSPSSKFKIDSLSGDIRVKDTTPAPELDYESTTSYTLQVKASNGQGDRFANVTIELKNKWDEAPYDLTLSYDTIRKNPPVDTIIGLLSSSDPEPGDTAIYSILDYTSFFTIEGNQLKTFSSVPQGKYPVTLKVKDRDTNNTTLSCTLFVVNFKPDSIKLSNSSAPENLTIGTEVCSLITFDRDTGDSHTYRVVGITGGTYSDYFTISGNKLIVNRALEDGNLFVSIESHDGIDSLTTTFPIVINAVNNTPTDITLSNNSITEGYTSYETIGILATVDPDGEDSHILSFDGGANDNDFVIDNDTLKITTTGYSDGTVLNIKIKTVDDGTPPDSMTKDLSVSINTISNCIGIDAWSSAVTNYNGGDLVVHNDKKYRAKWWVNNEPPSTDWEYIEDCTGGGSNNAPTDISISNSSIDEGHSSGTNVGTFTTVDDAGDNHTYTFNGGPDDANFTISGDLLQTSGSLSAGTYTISILSTDDGSLTCSKNFTITVNSLGGSICNGVPNWVGGAVTPNNGDKFVHNDNLYEAQNSPGSWEEPGHSTSSQTWFWIHHGSCN